MQRSKLVENSAREQRAHHNANDDIRHVSGSSAREKAFNAIPITASHGWISHRRSRRDDPGRLRQQQHRSFWTKGLQEDWRQPAGECFFRSLGDQ